MTELERTLRQAQIEQEHGANLADLLTDLQHAQTRLLDRLEVAEAKIGQLFEAFPGTDPDAHRRYHETLIEEVAERKKLRHAIQEKTLSALLWSGIVALSTAVYHHFFK